MHALSRSMSTKTPASPRSPTTLVAKRTSGSVTDASGSRIPSTSRPRVATTLPRDADAPRPVRVWVDLTNSPHVLVMRPIVEALRARGAEVEVTARDFAQTVGLASRATALARWAGRRGRSRGRFDLALGHGSNDVTVAAALLRIPRSTMFDYEWAAVQHTVNCRLAQAVVVPDTIPPARLRRYGARGKLQRYPGLKEEYYLADF